MYMYIDLAFSKEIFEINDFGAMYRHSFWGSNDRQCSQKTQHRRQRSTISKAKVQGSKMSTSLCYNICQPFNFSFEE